MPRVTPMDPTTGALDVFTHHPNGAARTTIDFPDVALATA